jgi:hypothetical protein
MNGMIVLTFLCTTLRDENKFVSGHLRILKAQAQWWFSRTDWSLYKTATAVSAFIWYWLLKPVMNISAGLGCDQLAQLTWVL